MTSPTRSIGSPVGVGPTPGVLSATPCLSPSKSFEIKSSFSAAVQANKEQLAQRPATAGNDGQSGWWWHTQDLVRAVPIFRRLSKEQIQALCDALWSGADNVQKFHLGDIIFHHQQELKGMYIIGEGVVTATRGRGLGLEEAYFRAGDVFGVPALLERDKTSDARYVAESDNVKLLLCTADVFRDAVGPLDLLFGGKRWSSSSPASRPSLDQERPSPSTTPGPASPSSPPSAGSAQPPGDKKKKKHRTDQSFMGLLKHSIREFGRLFGYGSPRHSAYVKEDSTKRARADPPGGPVSPGGQEAPGENSPTSSAGDVASSPALDHWITADVEEAEAAMCAVEELEVLEEIGKGGTASVMRAHVVATGRPCALKVINVAKARRAGWGGHVLQEVQILQAVQHPGCPFIIRTLSCFQDHWNLYIAMELQEGGDLVSRMEAWAAAKWPPASTLRLILAQVLEALDYLHGTHSVMFRDLKPGNILTCRSSHLVKLADLGFAKHLEPEEPPSQPPSLPPTGYSTPERVSFTGKPLGKRLPGQLAMSTESLSQMMGPPCGSGDRLAALVADAPAGSPPRGGPSAGAPEAPGLVRLDSTGTRGFALPPKGKFLAPLPNPKIHAAAPLRSLTPDSSTVSSARGFSGCGTTSYTAPEVLTDQGAAFPADCWSLGILVFHLFMGHTPFDDSRLGHFLTEDQVAYNIVHNKRCEFTGPEAAKGLVDALVVHSEADRMTLPEARTHQFFAALPWPDLHCLALKPMHSY